MTKDKSKTEAHLIVDITERREAKRTEILLDIYIKAPQLTDKDLYDYVLEKTVDLTESAIGFFHQVSDDQKTVILTTWDKGALKTCTAVYDTHYSIDSAGNWVDCVRLKQPVVYNDFANSPNQKGLPERHTPMKRFMSIPVMEGEKVRFIFGVGNKPVDYNEQDVAHLQLVANELQKIIMRRRAERELRQYKHIVSSSTEMMALLDTNFIYLVANAAYLKAFDKTPDELIGHTAPEIFGEGFFDKVIKPNAERCLAGEEVHYQDWFEYPASGRRYMDVAYFPYILADEEIRGFIVTSRNITEQKRDEEELEKHREHLEELVEERTTDIDKRVSDVERLNAAMVNLSADLQSTNANLELATRQLSAANKELEAFSYSVSHDLRAPLRGINGFSQALLEDYEDKLDAQGKDYLQRVRAASQHMDQLIDDLLGLSRVTRAEMTHATVNLSSLARQIVKELQDAQPERRVEFALSEGLEAEGDARLLRAMLENLLVNAWKFTGKRSDAKIEFGVAEVDGESAFFVRDNGAGFDMAYADKLFAPFQRLHSPDEFPGTGIGTATVQRIIHRHGGRVWAEGEIDKGATFYFTLSGEETR